jgi:hypothetical protein
VTRFPRPAETSRARSHDAWSSFMRAASCSIAANTIAASSAGNTASITTMPSSRSRRVTIRRARTSSTDSASCRCTERSARQMISSCAAVVQCASSRSAASIAGVATRVIARTFEYDRASFAQRRVDPWQFAQRPRHPQMLARRARIPADPPRQPARARPRARLGPVIAASNARRSVSNRCIAASR